MTIPDLPPPAGNSYRVDVCYAVTAAFNGTTPHTDNARAYDAFVRFTFPLTSAIDTVEYSRAALPELLDDTDALLRAACPELENEISHPFILIILPPAEGSDVVIIHGAGAVVARVFGDILSPITVSNAII